MHAAERDREREGRDFNKLLIIDYKVYEKRSTFSVAALSLHYFTSESTFNLSYQLYNICA